MVDLLPYLIAALAFFAVAGAAFVVGQYLSTQFRLQRRVTAAGPGADGEANLFDGVNVLVANYFDEKKFGVIGPIRTRLRRDLVRAGFFGANAVNFYIFFKLLVVVAFPLLAYLLSEIFLVGFPWWVKPLVIVVTTAFAIAGPDAYIARRQRILQGKYRVAFPELLDLLVVCVDAGLSIEAAFERIRGQVMTQNRQLGMNLLILGAEARAGRSTIDALNTFAERLGLDEARSFVAMLRQSIELGTDVGDALRVYSDEMRDRRMLRAEERANQLPVKAVLPLALIFLTIMLMVMTPVIIRLLSLMK